MLHRSFKPAKCKTALKLAVSRIKVLNNKREVQVKQIKRELAQLIESGQIQTARIRVEHVIREEKSSTAYNLIEIYCELIAARLPIIESQKNCPIDLKEAVTSVIYACARCSDVPELADIKKHLTAKYGKEFVNAAIDLRPDCGVNRMLVEKLSAKAPDGQTKLKVLTAIAEEHNVKWNPDLFSESDPKPPQDLLNGPSTFETASKIHTEAPPGPARPSHDERAPPYIQVLPKHTESNDASVNFNEENTRRSSSGYQNFASTGVGPNNKTTSSAFHPEERTSGTRTEWTEHKQSYPRDENASSSGRQDWGMQFKDATSAAQAAAESAELASMAARAAAELSRQHSTESSKSHGDASRDESLKSYGYGPKDESPRVYAGSKLQSDLVEKGAERNSFHGRNLGRRDGHIVDKGQEELSGPSERLVRDVYKNNDGDGKAAPGKSTTASIDDASPGNSFKRADGYPQKKSFKSYETEFLDESNRKSQAGDHNLRSEGKIQDSVKSEEISYFDERVTRKQSSSVSRRSRHSQSSSFSDEQEEVSRKKNEVTYFEETKTKKQPSRASPRSHSSTSGEIHGEIFKRNEHSGDPFVRGDSGVDRHSSGMNSKENSACFDDYGSDDDHNKVDLMNFKEQETSSRFSPPSSKASMDLLADSTAWSPRKNSDEGLQRSAPPFHPSVFSESSEVSSLPSQSDHLPPVAAYDDYDSPSSDSEQDQGESKMTETTDLRKVPSVKTVPASEDRYSEGENVESRRKLQSSAIDQPEQVVPSRRRQGVISKPVSEKKFDDDDDDELQTDRPSSKITKSRLESTERITEEVYDFSKDSELLSDSSSGSGSELKLETLTGGLLNKGNRRPPYMRKPSGKPFGVKEKTEDDRSDEQLQSSSRSSTVRLLVESSGGNQEAYGERSSSKQSKKPSMRTIARHVDSDDDNLEEELQQDSRINRPSFNLKSGIEPNKKPSSRAPRTYFDSDNSDAEEEVSKSNSPVIARPGSAFSRRTKISSPDQGRTHSKTSVSAEESVTATYRSESKLYSTGSLVGDSLPKTRGKSYSKPIISSLDKAASPTYGAERESSSSSSYVGETLPKTTAGQVYSGPTASSTPSYRVESRFSSRNSHVSESLPKAIGTTYSRTNVPAGESVEPEASPKTTGRGYSRTTVPSRESAVASHRGETKSYFSSSNVGETTAKPSAETRGGSTGPREQRRSSEQDSPKSIPEPRRSSRTDSSKLLQSEQKSDSPPKSMKSDAGEASKTPAVSRETSSKDKASHVHPNLPDSDGLTAFFQALKQPRE